MMSKNKNKTSVGAPGAFALAPKKSLSQNFLQDRDVLLRIASFARRCTPASAERGCVEVGPGSGALTEVLLSQGWQVHCIEKDSRAVEGLKTELLPQHPNALTIEQGSVLKWLPTNQQPCLCIGNLPYAISSDFFLWFYEHRSHFSHGLFMVQDEVAERLVAKTSTKDYGRLSVRMQLGFSITKLFTVPPEAFFPRPKVNSAVILLEPLPFVFETPELDKSFSQFTATLFSARRKMLRGTLGHWPPQAWEEVASQGIVNTMRPDALTPLQVLELFWVEKKYK